MKIYLKEIQENDSEIEATEADAWVRDSIAALDECPSVILGNTESLRPASLKAETPPRPTSVRFNMRRVDDVIMVSGDMETTVQLLCSRCAAPFLMPFNQHFTAMYCKDKEMAGIAYLDKNSNPRGQNKGHARHAHDFNAPQGIEAAEDLEINYIAEEYLDLALVLTEQVTVRIPFQPLCKEDCKGVCATCGADLNVGRCACAKIRTTSPFAGLKNIKLNS
ncbi:MAG: DUF177 domain-containing protein [Cryobacterium sp.]|nr:DUF177 domain-containing protein [Oligoflexia bacterium]